MKPLEPLPGALRSFARTAAVSFMAEPRLGLLMITLIPLSWVPGPLYAWWIKLLADAAVERSASGAAGAAAGLAVSVVVGYVGIGVGMRVRYTFEDRAGRVLRSRLAGILSSTPHLEHFERPEYADRLELLQEEAWMLTNVWEAVLESVGGLVRLVITSILLAQIHPALVLLTVFGVPSVLANARATRRLQSAEELGASARRTARHLFEAATEAGAGAEIRVFGLAGDLVGRRAAAWRTWHDTTQRAHWRNAFATSLASLVFASAFAGAVAFVASRAAAGSATAGDVLLAVVLGTQVNHTLGLLVDMVSWTLSWLRASQRFVWLERHDAARRPRAGAAGAPPPEQLTDGICLEEVSFRYPGSDRPALCDVSLHLPAGTVVAIVGDNGAGKTTLVKLLAGMYAPVAGRILVDGADLTSIDVDAWRSRLSAAFQDFARFELLASETIGVGDVSRMSDLAAVSSATERGAATGVVGSLPSGLATQLGPTWPGGVELSTGQWQKLALARGMMRGAPLLLLLDEPTASLDAQTEHDLFERFVDAARASRAASGAITVLVSHRFSTVRSADLIVVLSDGRVMETGSHEELIAAAGAYAELYALQQRAYRQ